MRIVLIAVTWLLLANSLAWAAEQAAEAVDAHDVTPLLDSGNTAPEPGHASHSDHCCHSSAHFVGFASGDAPARTNPAVRTSPALATGYRSLRHAPPTQPPRL